ncbi:phospholipase A1-like [Chrysoperla carnea]|uniref:phospholipase A1-like n=1 Tax=Chrysoperla carnea TaxID=189513 RepID=UPI001D0669B7|nr:phospholipase A1-like [Chrysoperla carnea]
MFQYLRIITLLFAISITLSWSAPTDNNDIRLLPKRDFASYLDSLLKIEQDNVIENAVDSSEEDSSEEEPEIEHGDSLTFQGEDGIWRTIDLTASLESDELYDFHNLSWVDEPEYNDNILHGRDAIVPRKVSNHVSHSLYVRTDPDTPYDVTPVNGRDAPFDINHPTKVIVHGWLENEDKNWLKSMKDKYFIGGNYNVMIVDWQHYATMEYTIAARKTRNIGAYLGQVLVSLIKAEKIRVEDIHIVGFSLGAHVSGVAAKTILAQTGKKVGRITGLDPAAPLFEIPLLASKKKRLIKEDALFTDVIHTCAGSLGFKRNVGHADFYPNKGENIQPGCGIIKNIVCSHNRAHLFYSESINSERFVATACPSWKKYKKGKCNGNEVATMGLYLDSTKASGEYYLHTKSKAPYALGN